MANKDGGLNASGEEKMRFSEQLEEDIAFIEPALERYISTETNEGFDVIFEAAKYSVMAGGKRLRPVLVLEFCRLCGGDVKRALPIACALELIHTYSLIHDDLPCMDDDDLRRGRPACHKKYGEATAVLAGDGLLTRAFEIAAENESGIPAEDALLCVGILGKAAGMNGMVGGQVLDMESGNECFGEEKLRLTQKLKTGCLLKAACELGCVAAGKKDEETLSKAARYGEKLGLAFQIQDDILDIEGDEKTLGKAVGQDAQNRKTTFPSLLGMDECRRLVRSLTEEAADSIAALNNSGFLIKLALSLVGRTR